MARQMSVKGLNPAECVILYDAPLIQTAASSNVLGPNNPSSYLCLSLNKVNANSAIYLY